MNYALTARYADSPGLLDISDQTYDLLKNGASNLLELLSLEETLDLVFENYCEYEKELLFIAARNAIFFEDNLSPINYQRIVVCRRIVNLLSVCKMYVDQSQHHIMNIYGQESKILKKIKTETSIQYDQNLGYRIMEAIRNYSQHRGFPIHSIQFSDEWIDTDSENSKLSHIVIPKLNLTYLTNDDKFKKSVLNELFTNKKPESIDIRPLIRNYVECIGKIHETIRNETYTDVKVWEDSITEVFSKYQEKFFSEFSASSLSVVTKKDDSHFNVNFTIHKEILKRRQNLEMKNRVYSNLSKRFASNEIR